MRSNLKLGISLGGTAASGVASSFPGALYSVDFAKGAYFQGSARQASHTTVSGYTAGGVQNINASGLLCDASGYGYLATPAWPAGDWTLVIQANGLGTADDRPLFSLRAAGAYDPEFFTYTYNTISNINAKEVVGAVTAFESFVVDTAPAPVRVVLTKNGTTVRSSANGQAARAQGSWTAFTPTRLHLGTRGDLDQFRFGGRITAYALYAVGKTDAEIQALSAVP